MKLELHKWLWVNECWQYGLHSRSRSSVTEKSYLPDLLVWTHVFHYYWGILLYCVLGSCKCHQMKMSLDKWFLKFKSIAPTSDLPIPNSNSSNDSSIKKRQVIYSSSSSDTPPCQRAEKRWQPSRKVSYSSHFMLITFRPCNMPES